MSDRTPAAPFAIERLSQPRPLREQLAEDARAGLTATPKLLPPKYFYDARGSELFEAITHLPEYYLTRCETAILEEHADRLVAAIAPEEIVELGSGSSRKTTLLLDAMHLAASGDRYVPLDISEAALAAASAALADAYPWLEVRAMAGDFATDLARLPSDGRRLVAFLGSTVGNLLARERAALFATVARSLRPGDAFLLGADLVKPPAVLVPAYDDAAGVTAEFNRNMLRVLNRELDGDLPVDDFRHRAVWNRREERIEMHLVAQREIEATLGSIGLRVGFGAGEPLVTEYSCKFRVEGLRRELGRAGLVVREVVTDRRGWFAVLVVVADASRHGPDRPHGNDRSQR